jgi:two-component system phosphate regulon response regulator PhoB
MKTILLADDEPHLRLLVSTTLDNPTYRILEAEDGATALALGIEEKPDLLILDWMMPGMSGLEVAREMRRSLDTSTLPILMLTAKGQKIDKIHAEAAGVSAYLLKPFSPLELLEKVESLLHGERTDKGGT